ncbi:hypothetical protein C2G38_2226195 [Gigaspora rosea]|uniref:Uncharacterized protein n=1 Tax=Gigaspora rosea TaxID=44941 RepID=A0A397U2P4_9GLOM|nr:hypothetical protein C2G38_2226195 [Gigaspora rosea]
MAHERAPPAGIEFEKMNDPNALTSFQRYYQSKLANFLKEATRGNNTPREAPTGNIPTPPPAPRSEREKEGRNNFTKDFREQMFIVVAFIQDSDQDNG